MPTRLNKEDSHVKHGAFLGRLRLVTLLVTVTFVSMITVPAWSQTSSADTQEGTASGAGIQAASAVATILYFPLKAAFALGGGIVGGLAYAFSGGSAQTAKNIWIPSMYGTYVITPEHLTGDRAVRFLGVAADEPASDAAPLDSPPVEPIR